MEKKKVNKKHVAAAIAAGRDLMARLPTIADPDMFDMVYMALKETLGEAMIAPPGLDRIPPEHAQAVLYATARVLAELRVLLRDRTLEDK